MLHCIFYFSCCCCCCSSRPRHRLPYVSDIRCRLPEATSEVRWLVIFKRLILGLGWIQVDCDLCGASKHFQQDMIKLFLTTGDVKPKRYPKERRGTKMTAARDMQLLGAVLDDPTATLDDHSAKIHLTTGISISASSLCRAMRRVGLSHKRVRSRQPPHGCHHSPRSALIGPRRFSC